MPRVPSAAETDIVVRITRAPIQVQGKCPGIGSIVPIRAAKKHGQGTEPQNSRRNRPVPLSCPVSYWARQANLLKKLACRAQELYENLFIQP